MREEAVFRHQYLSLVGNQNLFHDFDWKYNMLIISNSIPKYAQFLVLTASFCLIYLRRVFPKRHGSWQSGLLH